MLRITKKTVISIILAITLILSAPLAGAYVFSDADSVAEANTSYRYTRQFLTKSQKYIYDKYSEAIKNGKSSCTFDTTKYNVSLKNVAIAEHAIWMDYPEYGYWIYYNWDYDDSYVMKKKEVRKVKIRYDKELKERIPEYTQKVKEIAAEVKSNCSTDYEKVIYIHDYLCDLISYSDERVEEMDVLLGQQTSFGPLLDGKCACEGYAKAFQQLCLKSGVKALTVGCYMLKTDEIEERENIVEYQGKYWAGHAINMARIDGKWYYFDVTNDDGAGGWQFWNTQLHNYDRSFKSYEDMLEEYYFIESGCKWSDYMEDFHKFLKKIMPETASESLNVPPDYDVYLDGKLDKAALEKVYEGFSDTYVVTDDYDGKEKYIRTVSIKYDGTEDICSWLFDNASYFLKKAGMTGEVWTADPRIIDDLVFFGIMQTKED